jgi:hypothetical protein
VVNKNEYPLDRRSAYRFKVPDSQVSYKLLGGGSARTSLMDMTKSSVRFEIRHRVDPGELVEVILSVPNKERISAKGHIVWVSNSKPPFYAVVQLLPFGTDKRYNTLQCLEQLKELEQEYLFKII